MSVLSKEIKQAQEQATIQLLQKYEKQWFYGNDSYYYYYLRDFKFFKCDGNKIINRHKLLDKEIASFEIMEEHIFKEELDAILAKAYLTGVYIRRWKTTINIME